LQAYASGDAGRMYICMNTIECINCHQQFESDNEDDLVQQICPECLDGDGGLTSASDELPVPDDDYS